MCLCRLYVSAVSIVVCIWSIFLLSNCVVAYMSYVSTSPYISFLVYLKNGWWCHVRYYRTVHAIGKNRQRTFHDTYYPKYMSEECVYRPVTWFRQAQTFFLLFSMIFYNSSTSGSSIAMMQPSTFTRLFFILWTMPQRMECTSTRGRWSLIGRSVMLIGRLCRWYNSLKANLLRLPKLETHSENNGSISAVKTLSLFI